MKILAPALSLVLLSQSAVFAYPQDGKVLLPDGTEFTVLLMEKLSSKTVTEGDPVNFRVADDVKVSGQTLIAKGTLVKGVVTSAVRSGRGGKGGKLGVRVLSVRAADGQKVALRAASGRGGGDKTGMVIALSFFVTPFFLLKKGHDAKMKAGTPLQVFTDEDKEIGLGGHTVSPDAAEREDAAETRKALEAQQRKRASKDWWKMGGDN